jgi:hypothetical protein
MFENSTLHPEQVHMLAKALLFLGLFFTVIYLFYCLCMGKLLRKAGKPLWAGFIPVYNLVVLLEIIGRPWWWILVLIGIVSIPFSGLHDVIAAPIAFLGLIAINIIIGIDVAKSFGKDTVFGVLFGILGFIFLPIMAYSSSIQYVGPRASGFGLPSEQL